MSYDKHHQTPFVDVWQDRQVCYSMAVMTQNMDTGILRSKWHDLRKNYAVYRAEGNVSKPCAHVCFSQFTLMF